MATQLAQRKNNVFGSAFIYLYWCNYFPNLANLPKNHRFLSVFKLSKVVTQGERKPWSLDQLSVLDVLWEFPWLSGFFENALRRPIGQ